MTAVDDAIALLEGIKRRMIDGTPLDIGTAFEISDVLRSLEAMRAPVARPAAEPASITSVSDEAHVFITSSTESTGDHMETAVPQAFLEPSGSTACTVSGAETVEDHGRRLRWPSRSARWPT